MRELGPLPGISCSNFEKGDPMFSTSLGDINAIGDDEMQLLLGCIELLWCTGEPKFPSCRWSLKSMQARCVCA